MLMPFMTLAAPPSYCEQGFTAQTTCMQCHEVHHGTPDTTYRVLSSSLASMINLEHLLVTHDKHMNNLGVFQHYCGWLKATSFSSLQYLVYCIVWLQQLYQLYWSSCKVRRSVVSNQEVWNKPQVGDVVMLRTCSLALGFSYLQSYRHTDTHTDT